MQDYAAHIAVVMGSGHELNVEIRDLLKSRLRLAALALFVGNTLFLGQHYYWADFSKPPQPLFAFDVFLTVVLAQLGSRCAGDLRPRCSGFASWS